MSKLERLIAAVEENTRVGQEQNALLRELLGHRDQVDSLLSSYGRNAHVTEKIGVKDGLPSREIAYLHFPDDLESYGDWDSAS